MCENSHEVNFGGLKPLFKYPFPASSWVSKESTLLFSCFRWNHPGLGNRHAAMKQLPTFKSLQNRSSVIYILNPSKISQRLVLLLFEVLYEVKAWRSAPLEVFIFIRTSFPWAYPRYTVFYCKKMNTRLYAYKIEGKDSPRFFFDGSTPVVDHV